MSSAVLRAFHDPLAGPSPDSEIRMPDPRVPLDLETLYARKEVRKRFLKLVDALHDFRNVTDYEHRAAQEAGLAALAAETAGLTLRDDLAAEFRRMAIDAQQRFLVARPLRVHPPKAESEPEVRRKNPPRIPRDTPLRPDRRPADDQPPKRK